MRLFFDENLSHRLVALLSDLYPGSTHVRYVDLVGASDEVLWEYARRNDLVLVSKDTDFYQRSMLRGAPPKVICVQVGNLSTGSIARLLRERYEIVKEFSLDKESACLVLRGTPGTWT